MLIAVLAASGLVEPGWQERIGRLSAFGVFAGVVGTVLYHTVAEATGGATIGKALCGLRVRSEDFSPCGFRGALIRNLGYFIDAFFCGLVAYGFMSKSPLRQRLGDEWGATVVVKLAGLEQAQPSRLGVGGGIALSLFLWLLLLTASMLVRAL